MSAGPEVKRPPHSALDCEILEEGSVEHEGEEVSEDTVSVYRFPDGFATP